jgi:hypothetical protein
MKSDVIPSSPCLVAWEETHDQAGGKKVHVRRKVDESFLALQTR